ncbi:hypothetical protein SNEBB_000740 [Seison nebaliae]|nr:hypothetical protein SNEBB_000740 [Seison nebaliae]
MSMMENYDIFSNVINLMFGVGIYSLSGEIIANYAGSSAFIAFIIAGILVILINSIHSELLAIYDQRCHFKIFQRSVSALVSFILMWTTLISLVLVIIVSIQIGALMFDMYMNNYVERKSIYIKAKWKQLPYLFRFLIMDFVNWWLFLTLLIMVFFSIIHYHLKCYSTKILSSINIVVILSLSFTFIYSSTIEPTKSVTFPDDNSNMLASVGLALYAFVDYEHVYVQKAKIGEWAAVNVTILIATSLYGIFIVSMTVTCPWILTNSTTPVIWAFLYKKSLYRGAFVGFLFPYLSLVIQQVWMANYIDELLKNIGRKQLIFLLAGYRTSLKIRFAFIFLCLAACIGLGLWIQTHVMVSFIILSFLFRAVTHCYLLLYSRLSEPHANHVCQCESGKKCAAYDSPYTKLTIWSFSLGNGTLFLLGFFSGSLRSNNTIYILLASVVVLCYLLVTLITSFHLRYNCTRLMNEDYVSRRITYAPLLVVFVTGASILIGSQFTILQLSIFFFILFIILIVYLLHMPVRRIIIERDRNTEVRAQSEEDVEGGESQEAVKVSYNKYSSMYHMNGSSFYETEEIDPETAISASNSSESFQPIPTEDIEKSEKEEATRKTYLFVGDYKNDSTPLKIYPRPSTYVPSRSMSTGTASVSKFVVNAISERDSSTSSSLTGYKYYKNIAYSNRSSLNPLYSASVNKVSSKRFSKLSQIPSNKTLVVNHHPAPTQHQGPPSNVHSEKSKAEKPKPEKSKAEKSKVDKSKVDKSKVDKSKVDKQNRDKSKPDKSKHDKSKHIRTSKVRTSVLRSSVIRPTHDNVHNDRSSGPILERPSDTKSMGDRKTQDATFPDRPSGYTLGEHNRPSKGSSKKMKSRKVRSNRKRSKGRSTYGKSVHSRSIRGKSSRGKSSRGKTSRGKSSRGKTSHGKSSWGRSVRGKSSSDKQVRPKEKKRKTNKKWKADKSKADISDNEQPSTYYSKKIITSRRILAKSGESDTLPSMGSEYYRFNSARKGSEEEKGEKKKETVQGNVAGGESSSIVRGKFLEFGQNKSPDTITPQKNSKVFKSYSDIKLVNGPDSSRSASNLSKKKSLRSFSSKATTLDETNEKDKFFSEVTPSNYYLKNSVELHNYKLPSENGKLVDGEGSKLVTTEEKIEEIEQIPKKNESGTTKVRKRMKVRKRRIQKLINSQNEA